ncbi:hypothetical protein ACRN9C_20055 [Shewanella frigidimarina]|uniref:hypothetical protein n=1 Tax=Shewanella TaxID=22 RepID=UPI00160006A9|nr:hypothetical protein [Shewanella sp. SG44-2]MBB1424862.1 hypothetical protein [Shewanella sp. SG44-2]
MSATISELYFCDQALNHTVYVELGSVDGKPSGISTAIGVLLSCNRQAASMQSSVTAPALL